MLTFDGTKDGISAEDQKAIDRIKNGAPTKV